MGFFSDLKEDLSQAVNELMPDEEKESAEAESQTLADMADRLETVGEADFAESGGSGEFESQSEEDKLLAELFGGSLDETQAESVEAAEIKEAEADEMSDVDKMLAEAKLAVEEEDAVQLSGASESFADLMGPVTEYTSLSDSTGDVQKEEDKLLAELFSGSFDTADAESAPEAEAFGQTGISTDEEPAAMSGGTADEVQAHMPVEEAAEETQAELPVEEAAEKAQEDISTAEKTAEASQSVTGAENTEQSETDRIIKMEADNMSEEVMEMDNTAVDEEVNEVEKEGVGKMQEQVFGEDEVATDEKSIITEAMTITGDIISRGSMEVLGTITGNIDILGKLDVTGVVNGNSKAAEIYAESAKIVGEVNSLGSVKVGQSSVIIGNIMATSAVIAGAVKGDIDVKGPVILDTSAIVMGNIKSKSVQINNGAVVEGMCSQCYADVNPTAFFDEFKKTAKI